MKDTFTKTFQLWKSLDNMATAMSVSRASLTALFSARQIPSEKYDQIFISRAVYLNIPLSRDDLRAYRFKDVSAKYKAVRQDKIQNFYEACGGVDVVATKIGSTVNALYIAKNRGKLPPPKKYEIMTLAASNGIELSPILFEPIKVVNPSQKE